MPLKMIVNPAPTLNADKGMWCITGEMKDAFGTVWATWESPDLYPTELDGKLAALACMLYVHHKGKLPNLCVVPEKWQVAS